MKKLLPSLILLSSPFIGLPLAQAEQAQTATITVVISEEAAQYHRENPVPDERPRQTALVNEQPEVDVAGVASRSQDPLPLSLPLMLAVAIYVVGRAGKRLRIATAVG